jgi:hypothetical protein
MAAIKCKIECLLPEEDASIKSEAVGWWYSTFRMDEQMLLRPAAI